jgi:hypothetical protein
VKNNIRIIKATEINAEASWSGSSSLASAHEKNRDPAAPNPQMMLVKKILPSNTCTSVPRKNAKATIMIIARFVGY